MLCYTPVVLDRILCKSQYVYGGGWLNIQTVGLGGLILGGSPQPETLWARNTCMLPPRHPSPLKRPDPTTPSKAPETISSN